MQKKHASVEAMWSEYLNSIDEDIKRTEKRYTSWHFCSDESSANNLAKLVLEGTKRGTAGLHELYKIDGDEIPADGCYSIVTDWEGVAQCVIQSKKVTILPFREVDAELAFIEGEGDKSLDYWRREHIKFFTEELKEYGMEFSEDLLVVFEEFQVVFDGKP